jgi:hypothetical protein
MAEIGTQSISFEVKYRCKHTGALAVLSDGKVGIGQYRKNIRLKSRDHLHGKD